MTTNYELRPGQGSAFKNKNKTEDWHPAYKGEVMLPDGTLHWIDIKPGKTKAGEHWFALKIGAPKQPKQTCQPQGMVLDSAPARPFAAPVAPTPNPTLVARSVAAMDDDIPF
jgi:hypothetical protein